MVETAPLAFEIAYKIGLFWLDQSTINPLENGVEEVIVLSADQVPLVFLYRVIPAASSAT